ncbi:hypothetical protein PHYBLDRAFT_147192 [Phycomyces blakesleeanus NRRL 1555(-)]|uniref:Uncharacterized protein n=1 Tax=Phycomyces blakesleeanus (strain ATCC 8743b / DSM 1359 / FGSC 10004 / NBRC 33097 / NRRL 1555) TaxID=763407 RepID=A0A163DLW6_PHYB8|nr:hypothetical protein PHYBLDRAFT_147192 [Phycomyces blakesleeanus NRRL 1555(-)]OAD72220.1 hypothetical protein PHYBLDRAFT_147192 [Phycomyces blakesleeanus NRRL 1555(-)]|eukprot:XP_018290260.1 hypothetical protein PHYBLDRAFT_147192 [Phycomyces blakesleeanus NRRL 1555(-)]
MKFWEIIDVPPGHGQFVPPPQHHGGGPYYGPPPGAGAGPPPSFGMHGPRGPVSMSEPVRPPNPGPGGGGGGGGGDVVASKLCRGTSAFLKRCTLQVVLLYFSITKLSNNF